MHGETKSPRLLDQIDAQVATNNALARDMQNFRAQASSAMPGSVNTSPSALLSFAASTPLPLDPKEIEACALAPLFSDHVALLGQIDKSDILALTTHITALTAMLKTKSKLGSAAKDEITYDDSKPEQDVASPLVTSRKISATEFDEMVDHQIMMVQQVLGKEYSSADVDGTNRNKNASKMTPEKFDEMVDLQIKESQDTLKDLAKKGKQRES